MLDINKLYTNNICEMASVYGIEAAYCAIKKVSTLCQEAICNSYTMATRDLPDIYARALGLHQANPEWPWYK